MGRKKKEEEHENLERWLVSYGDFITLLFATFVVLYALSQIDVAEFSKLEESIAKAFAANKSTLLDGQGSLMESLDSNSPVDTTSANSVVEALMMEYLSVKYENDSFSQIKDELEEYAKDNKIDDITIEVDERGLVIRFDNSDILFPSGQAHLTPKAKELLDKVGVAIGQRFVMHLIRVDGFTDSLPVSNPIFPTNWELSTARSCAIVRYLIDRFKFFPDIFTAAGFGETRAIAPNDTAEGRTKNRRVEIIVLKNKYKKNEKYNDQFLKLDKEKREEVRREQLKIISKIKGISEADLQTEKNSAVNSEQKDTQEVIKLNDVYENEAERLNDLTPDLFAPIVKDENYVLDNN